MQIHPPYFAIALFGLLLALAAAPPSNAGPVSAAPLAPIAKADAQSPLLHDAKHRRRAHKRLTRRLYVPIAPNYSAYDYPYYYARGYYPTHIGPGYMYYGRPYRSYGSPYLPYQHRGYIRHGSRIGRF